MPSSRPNRSRIVSTSASVEDGCELVERPGRNAWEAARLQRLARRDDAAGSYSRTNLTVLRLGFILPMESRQARRRFDLATLVLTWEPFREMAALHSEISRL